MNNKDKLNQFLSKPAVRTDDYINTINGEFYYELICSTGVFKSETTNKKIVLKKKSTPKYTLWQETAEWHFGYLEGFLDCLSTDNFDAWAEFQEYCDRFLEEYE